MHRKTLFVRFSFVSVIRTITLEAVAVLCHHVSVPSALTPFLQHIYILMEPLPFFLTKIAKILWKSVQMAMVKVRLYAHIDTQIFKVIEQLLWQFFIPVCFVVTQEVLNN